MIVLDEQLLGRGIEISIAAWYPGSVSFITDLRPDTVIKDEAIPTILAQASEPTFVTINAIDFWQKVALSKRFCLICVAVPDSQTALVSELVRRLLRRREFRARSSRLGKAFHLTPTGASWYSETNSTIQELPAWSQS